VGCKVERFTTQTNGSMLGAFKERGMAGKREGGGTDMQYMIIA
jgi:hypothetical protein